MCQLVHCGAGGSDADMPAGTRLPVAFEVRQSRAGSALRGGSDSLAQAQNAPDCAAVRTGFVDPIKAAPFVRNIDPESRALPQPWRWLKR
jgi:hypothetical protein